MWRRPSGLPKISQLFEVVDAGSSERVLANLTAQLGANRILEDITRHNFGYFVSAQNVFVIAGLPQSALSGLLTVRVSRRLLEMLDESSKVGPVGERLGKRMDMIGHHAVRQKREVEQFRGFKELFDDACGQRTAGKHGA